MSKKANYMYLPTADLEIDLRNDTAVESDVAQGKTFHKADGTQAVGTAQGGSGDNTLQLNVKYSIQVNPTDKDLSYCEFYDNGSAIFYMGVEVPVNYTVSGNIVNVSSELTGNFTMTIINSKTLETNLGNPENVTMIFAIPIFPNIVYSRVYYSSQSDLYLHFKLLGAQTLAYFSDEEGIIDDISDYSKNFGIIDKYYNSEIYMRLVGDFPKIITFDDNYIVCTINDIAYRSE